MWKPFEPDVFTQLGRPSSASRSRSASAAARRTSGSSSRRIEIEDAEVRVVEVRHARRPHVRRDAVLVGQPEQRSRVGHERMVDGAVLLRHLDALEPGREALRHVLLQEPLLADAGGIALHRDRPAAEVRQHHRRDRLVVGGQLALGDAVVREQHLLGMRDHGVSRTTSRAALSIADAEQARMAQLAVHRPLDERDLHDDLRAHPVRAQARQPDAPS